MWVWLLFFIIISFWQIVFCHHGDYGWIRILGGFRPAATHCDSPVGDEMLNMATSQTVASSSLETVSTSEGGYSVCFSCLLVHLFYSIFTITSVFAARPFKTWIQHQDTALHLAPVNLLWPLWTSRGPVPYNSGLEGQGFSHLNNQAGVMPFISIFITDTFSTQFLIWRRKMKAMCNFKWHPSTTKWDWSYKRGIMSCP